MVFTPDWPRPVAVEFVLGLHIDDICDPSWTVDGEVVSGPEPVPVSVGSEVTITRHFDLETDGAYGAVVGPADSSASLECESEGDWPYVTSTCTLTPDVPGEYSVSVIPYLTDEVCPHLCELEDDLLLVAE